MHSCLPLPMLRGGADAGPLRSAGGCALPSVRRSAGCGAGSGRACPGGSQQAGSPGFRSFSRQISPGMRPPCLPPLRRRHDRGAISFDPRRLVPVVRNLPLLLGDRGSDRRCRRRCVRTPGSPHPGAEAQPGGSACAFSGSPAPGHGRGGLYPGRSIRNWLRRRRKRGSGALTV